MSSINCGCGAGDEGLLLCKNHREKLARIVAVDNKMSYEDVLYVFEHEGFTREEYGRFG